MELITPETLRHWRNKAVKTAKSAAATLEINMPAAITLGKPSGTVSQLVGCSSGMHSRWSDFYVRRVRISIHDALFKCMVEQGMPYEMDKGNHDTAVFSFPIASPEGAKLRKEDTAIGQLGWYKTLVENWSEQNISTTIYVKEEEWLDVTAYAYTNFDTINGITFFPYDNKRYEQAPYEEISEIEYHRMVKEMPDIDFSLLSKYETKDETEGAQTYACAGNSCEMT
jgi:ribonucleoside-diphosphate reductase alpha chain